ncbi:PorP/SprF family type IX secretion system membrane protein [Porifericola rhodea]|uniref:PorP/SprF family type IX secretion system membrane protein n=1 Tax=Porifericola rhodea TaxID=930972 RepID=UPI0026657EE6|nr:PorP/SprF family type IX secretion system membrane protein [Porifericola rhodea]WKN32483.1 PorP/SprF family type IX secretion system membrane protein [Porifericola rhodea]
MRAITIVLTIIFGGLWATDSYAQEPQFSNFYATHLYTNPAFSGRSDYQYRITADLRRQWQKVGSFSTAFVSADYAFSKFGVGFTAYSDEAGSTPLKTRHASMSVSYGTNISQHADLVIGFQGSYYHQNLGEDYIWVDDYLNQQTDISATNQSINNQYFNLSTGLLFIHRTFWLGLSLKDFLPNPGLNNYSPYGLISSSRTADGYYGRISAHGSYYRYILPNQLFFSSYFNYRSRASVRQWESGISLAYRPQYGQKPADIVLGLGGGYRGLVQTFEGLSSRDAVILNASLSWPNGISNKSSPLWHHIFQLVYSYDMTVSRLSTTGGAHELTLTLKFSDFRSGSSWPETMKARRHIPDPRDCKGGFVNNVYMPR